MTPQDELDQIDIQSVKGTIQITLSEIKRMKDEYLIRNPKEELKIE